MKNSRASLALAIILFYLLPVVVLSLYTMGLMPAALRWSLFSIGLLISMVGSAILFLAIYYWEQNLRQRLLEAIKPTQQICSKPDLKEEERLRQAHERHLQETLAPLQQKQDKLIADIASRDEELRQSLEERKHLQSQITTIREEYESFREKIQRQLSQEQQQNIDYQKTLSDQQSLISTLQQQITSLEVKERELSYEIKTLVSLSNYESSEKIYEPKKISSSSLESASRQLSHYIDTAVSIASVQNLQGVPTHLNDLSTDNFTLELRRLCENLNMENRYVVLLHSPKENKVIFVNDYVKTLLGWAPNKFIQQFPNIIEKGMEDWEKEMSVLTSSREAYCSLQVRSQSHELLPFSCLIRSISFGSFRNHVIALLYLK